MNRLSGRLLSVIQIGLRIIAILVITGIGFLQEPHPALAQGAQPGITSPAPGSSISGNVPIFGTAVIEPFQKYELHYKLEPSGDDAYIYFTGATSPVRDGQLGVWLAEGLAPGLYSLRLRVVKEDGNYAEYYAPNLSINMGPQPTPTPDENAEPTPTPIPTATFTPAPQPTPAVGRVEQPALEAPTPTASGPDADGGQGSVNESEQPSDVANAAAPEEPAEAPSASVTRKLGEAVSLSRLRTEFLNGVRISAALLLGVTALYGGKKLFSWVWTQFS